MKKSLIIFSEMVIVGVVLILGAHIWYNSPKNCVKCHEMQKSYDSWKASSHNSVNCLECHQERGIKGIIETKLRGVFRVFLHFTGYEAYELKTTVAKERCWRCHSSIRKRFRVGSVANLSDTHSIHLDRGFHCADCHKKAVHPEKVTESSLPTMRTCITCHEAEGISNECKICHLDVQKHQRIIALQGGLLLSEHNGCLTCHPLVSQYDNQIDHKKAIENVGGWKGSTAVCGQCHPQESKDIAHTVHSRLKSPVKIKSVSCEQGLITRFSYYWSNKAIVNWADLVEIDNSTTLSIGCGKCHIGGIVDHHAPSEIDCLICHAAQYDMKQRVVIDTPDGFQWSRDRNQEAAYSVGPTVTEYCNRCHADYMVKYRGTEFTPDTDVHAAMGIHCANCHTIKNHKIARGNHVTDLWANDLPAVAHSCIQCHPDRRHKDDRINRHLKKLSCEACHVKNVGGIISVDWTRAVDPDGDGIYSPYKEEASQAELILTWFNGDVGPSTKPIGRRNDNKSKIYPFKIIKTYVPFDSDKKMPLPLKLSVFYKTGDVTASIRAAVQDGSQPWSGQWERKALPSEGIYIQVNHRVSRKGKECKECHH